MTRLLQIACLFVLVCFLGCSFNRSDFVCGANGKADQTSMSDDGKTVENVVKNGPHVGLSF
jgi:hypothetical protein